MTNSHVDWNGLHDHLRHVLWEYIFKGTLIDLRQLLATESPLKMMKNAFHFILKALFALKIFKFLA